jgi:hypothetical protein
MPLADAVEPKPEEGYPPPDPAFYDSYVWDQVMQAFAQVQQKPQFPFMRRIDRMNWDFLDKIDVGAIARTDDVTSIDYLMHPVAFGNVATDGAKFFGSRASLHAFLILQMSVEVPLSQLATISVVPPPQPPSDVPRQHVAQYEAKIELLNRDLVITSRTERLRIAEQGRDDA